MRVLLYTCGMVHGTERLMPWRALLEVARYSPYEIAICSAQRPEPMRLYEGIRIFCIANGVEALRQFVEEGGWDVVYYPISYRQGLKNMRDLDGVKARKIAYVPGGIFPLCGSLALIKNGAAKLAFPYLLDSITPHKWISQKLQSVGFEAVVCQTPLTGRDARNSGWDTTIVALPGKDEEMSINCDLLCSLGLQEQKFILFSGAPAPARGAIMAMKAYDSLADELVDTKMVMLMRRDLNSDFTEFDACVTTIQHMDRFVICYDKLTREQLFCFFNKSYAVILPFLIVPSEIPLTFFEVMQMGTPVITFENGGTTDYLRNALKISKYRNVRSLANAIRSLCVNSEERNVLAENARHIMCNHPTWKQTSQKWLSVL